ncbi:BON domain-containing protein [Methylovirgula sp. 4M-Z18]|uniref:BON domain-containing protein n=1 Tax=Methylovirgula sp. 4M-Z18 TaxID=2293567 RepID=UPI000E2F12DC|nr:BON domain-containing protein [Methylovirgula sp. 4M-Z18]RFB76450.1 BON domain-containing protein [Methylovirgula sp. 4M-Z18]
MNDEHLRQNVLDELEFDPMIDAAKIGVVVENGIVTLSGHVGSYTEKIAAEQVVQRIRGVRGVAEEIEVRFPNDKKDADDEIAQRAAKILEWDASVPLGEIKVIVEQGRITLNGAVEWQFQRWAAEAAVRKLSGVRGVTNAIIVRPRASAGDIKHRIEDALKRNAELEAGGICVMVSGGKVTLDGKVRAWRERRVAEQAAWAAPGVVVVEDRLTVA